MPKTRPNGLVPVLLTQQWMDLWSLKTGDTMFDVVPYKEVLRDDLLNDIVRQGAISPFHKAKASLEVRNQRKRAHLVLILMNCGVLVGLGQRYCS